MTSSVYPAPTNQGGIVGQKPDMQEIFHFPAQKAALENIHTRPNGRLLLTAFTSGDLYTLDPFARSPQAQVLVSLTGATGLCGIAAVDEAANIYAIGGGDHISFGFKPGSTAVWVVKIGHDKDNDNSCTVLARIPVDATLNGMASIPAAPHLVLVADSKGGRIMRINTQTRQVDVAFIDPSLEPAVAFPIGINGARIRDNYFYFTNSGQGTFGRIPIDQQGNKVGDAEIITTLPQPPAAPDNAYDDFTFDLTGNAYIALHSSSFVKLTPKGVRTVFLNETDYSPELIEPTSAALSLDGTTLYLCTAGKTVGTTVYGGQVFKVKL